MVKHPGHHPVVADPTAHGKQVSTAPAIDGVALASMTAGGLPEEVAMSRVRYIAVFAVLALAGCTQNDTEITHRVQDRLADEGLGNQVKVETTRRVVKLEGVVADRQELNRAEMAARNTPGIMGVDNRLVVQNPVNVTGGSIDKDRDKDRDMDRDKDRDKDRTRDQQENGKPMPSPAGPRGPLPSTPSRAP